MAYTQTGLLDRSLSDEEEVRFKQWARDNFQPGDLINMLWHPVVRQECIQILLENGEPRLP
jgi:hypothetical protein